MILKIQPNILKSGSDSLSMGDVPEGHIFARSGDEIVGVKYLDVVGGRMDLVSSTQIKWGFLTSNQIRLWNPTSAAWEIVNVSTEPTLANNATDLNGTALAVDKIYDVFAEYVNSTSFVLKCSRWLTSTAGSSSRIGDYAAGTAYNIGDRVAYAGTVYVCIQAGTGQTPSSSPTYWVSNGYLTGGDGSINSGTDYCTAQMSSNSAPSPNVVSATAADAACPAWWAFNRADDSGGGGWKSGRLFNVQNYEVLSFDFGSAVAKVVNKYRLKSLNGANWNTDSPTAWTLRGSNVASPSLTNDSDWTTLHSVSGFSWSGQNVFSQFYTFSNSTPYRHYSFKVTAINGTPASNWVGIGEVVLVQQPYSDFIGLAKHDGIVVSDLSTDGKKRRWLGCIFAYNNSSTVNFRMDTQYCYISNFYNKQNRIIKTLASSSGSYVYSGAFRESNNGSNLLKGEVILSTSQFTYARIYQYFQGGAGWTYIKPRITGLSYEPTIQYAKFSNAVEKIINGDLYIGNGRWTLSSSEYSAGSTTFYYDTVENDYSVLLMFEA